MFVVRSTTLGEESLKIADFGLALAVETDASGASRSDSGQFNMALSHLTQT